LNEKDFFESFPSLKGKLHGVQLPFGLCNGFLVEDVRKNCVDKQKLKEIIIEEIYCSCKDDDNKFLKNPEEYCQRHSLIKRLGL